MNLAEKMVVLRRSGLTDEAIEALLDLTPEQRVAEQVNPATPDPAPAGGGGGGATHVVSAIAQVDHGLPPAVLAPGDHGLLLTPEITVEGFAVVDVRSYVEIDSQGGWWSPIIVDNGVSIMTDDLSPNPLGGAVSVPGWGFVAITHQGLLEGPANSGVPVALSGNDSAAAVGTVVVLPEGTHNLAIGIPTDMNAGSLGPGNPNVITRNAVLAVTVLA